jgi:hypothetical protein
MWVRTFTIKSNRRCSSDKKGWKNFSMNVKLFVMFALILVVFIRATTTLAVHNVLAKFIILVARYVVLQAADSIYAPIRVFVSDVNAPSVNKTGIASL